MAASKENIRNLNDNETLSRKEKLALYKRQKEVTDKTTKAVKAKDNKPNCKAVKNRKISNPT